jgi:hypothetical protein
MGREINVVNEMELVKIAAKTLMIKVKASLDPDVASGIASLFLTDDDENGSGRVIFIVDNVTMDDVKKMDRFVKSEITKTSGDTMYGVVRDASTE